MSASCARVPRVEKIEVDEPASDENRTGSKTGENGEPAGAASVKYSPRAD